MDQTARIRQFSGWFIRGIVRNHLEAPQTRLALDEEYWLALRHCAEVRPAGFQLLTGNNPAFAGLAATEQDQLWREFRAYIRQAEGFYRGACVLPWKSSPLNFYYSFMNLAKALAVARGLFAPQPSQDLRLLQHGLSARVLPGTPDTWKLTVRGADGLFALLYRATVGTSVPDGLEFDARRLLGYVSTITWQLDKSGTGVQKSWFPCRWIILTQNEECWDIIVVHREADIDRLAPSFGGVYQEVASDAARPFAFRVLGLHAVQANDLRFLERKVPVPTLRPGHHNVREIERSLREAAPNCVFEYLDGTDHQFCLGLPYSSGGPSIPMTELIASYAVTYFLSSAVRYHPDYMDKIGEASEAWLIESFAKSTPLSLLRQLTPAILGYTLIIESA